jgi:hypothetical protein
MIGRKLELAEIYEKLAQAEAQIKQGLPLVEGKQAFRNLRLKYNLSTSFKKDTTAS